METLLQDLRSGFRLLFRNRVFTIIALATLALGIGANTALFSVVDAILLRQLPFDRPDRLLCAWEKDKKNNSTTVVSAPLFLDWRQRNTVFDDMAAFKNWAPSLTGDQSPERIAGAFVTPNMFSLLGARALAGRTLSPQDEAEENRQAVVLSHGLWKARFASDPKIIEQSIMLDGQSYIVVGVMPLEFKFPLPDMIGPGNPATGADLWVPLIFDPASLNRSNHSLAVVARLKAGNSLEQAQAEMDTISADLEQEHPKHNTNVGVGLVPVSEIVVGRVRPTLLLLLGAVGFVLLIACANVTNLFLSRGESRRKEIAVRGALGASRGRLVRQMLTESIILSGVGGLLGLLLAWVGLGVLVRLSPADIHYANQPTLDGRVLGFTLGLSLLTGLLCGLVPALQVTRLTLAAHLREGAKGSGGFARNRFRHALIVAEIALALMLLVGAGLLIESFIRLQNVNPGFNADNVVTAQIALSVSRYKDQQKWAAFYERVIEKLQALPGVESAGAVSHLPLGGGNASGAFEIQGRPPLNLAPSSWVEMRLASPDYFRAVGIHLIRGRFFTEQDNQQAPNVAIINESMAARHWPGQDPIGQHISFNERDGQPLWREIVGVVNDVRNARIATAPNPGWYMPYRQLATPYISLVAKTGSGTTNPAEAIRSAVFELDKDQPVYNIRPMRELVSRSVSGTRFIMVLMGLLAAIALLLSVAGVYGVLSYSVSQRVREIGIRMAMGAQSADILRMVVGQGALLSIIGIVIGVGGALVLSRLMTGLLYEVRPADPVVFFGCSALIGFVALASSYIPARRATRIDPMKALRCE